MPFSNRTEAGRELAKALAFYKEQHPVILALPRGGAPVAAEIAAALEAPLDLVLVRKIGVPFQPELAMGAIGEGGVRVENADVLRSTGLDEADLAAAEVRERPEVERRASRYRHGEPRLPLDGRCALIVDDGIATGSTVRAACQVARRLGAARLVVAVPVASRLATEELRDVCDELISLAVPDPFFAVGEWYRDFSQTTDQEVADALRPQRSDPGAIGDGRSERPCESTGTGDAG